MGGVPTNRNIAAGVKRLIVSDLSAENRGDDSFASSPDFACSLQGHVYRGIQTVPVRGKDLYPELRSFASVEVLPDLVLIAAHSSECH